jgi:DNA-binding CsgD family transcriptional regulator
MEKKMKIWDKASDARILLQNDQEVWANVPDTNGNYLVSNKGRYFSVKNNKILRGSQSNTGYILYPCGPKGERSISAHRAVLMAFDGNPPSSEHTDARHLDSCKTNNSLSNLKWGTRSENMLDVWNLTKRGLPSSTTTVQPQTKASRTISEEKAKRILNAYSKGASIEDIAIMTDLSSDVIQRIVEGSTWSHLQQEEKMNSSHGRVGSTHHLSHLTEETLKEAFQKYVEQKMSYREFSRLLNINEGTARQILSGKTWRHVLRPPGFKYPNEFSSTEKANRGENHPMSKLRGELIQEVIDQIMSGEITCTKQIQEKTGWGRSNVLSFLRGKLWGHISRPEGFERRFREICRAQLPKEVQAQIVQRCREGLTRKEIMAEFNISYDQAGWYLDKANKAKKQDQNPEPKANEPESLQ